VMTITADMLSVKSQSVCFWEIAVRVVDRSNLLKLVTNLVERSLMDLASY